jgi:hypothetical protein
VDIAQVIEPSPGASAGVDASYETFRALYPALKPIFAQDARR